MMLRALIFALGVVLSTLAVTAEAQHSVVVLGLRSVEGDDEVAASLSRALRRAGSEVPEWFMRDQSVSLAQMVLVHGCDSVDTHCLSTIAKGLSVDRLLYGEIRRDGSEPGHGFEAEIHLFGAQAADVEGSAVHVFAAVEADDENLEEIAKELINQVNPDAPDILPPILTVQSNVDTADVKLNGQIVGQLGDGTLQLTGLEPGTYNVELSAPGYATGTRTVELVAGEATLLELPMLQGEPAPGDPGGQTTDPDLLYSRGPSIPRWLPYGLFGVSVAAIVGMVASWVVIDNVANDSLYLDYRAAQSGVSDVCKEAERGVPDGVPPGGDATQFDQAALDDIADMCNRASTFEVLQYVFGGVAAASAVAGVALLIFSLDEQQQANTYDYAHRASTVEVQPTFNQQYGGVTATLRF